MKGRIIVDIEEIPEDCYQCDQPDEYGYCHWVGKYIDHCSKIGERYPTCPIEPWEEESEVNKHEIKILPEYFEPVFRSVKRFELRKNDRDYQVGDRVTLKEWDGTEYTGNELTVGIRYVLKDCPEYGLMDGYCIFGW